MSGLDVPDLPSLLRAAADLAERQIEQTASGPVFDDTPSAARLADLLDGELPEAGEPVDRVLEAAARVLGEGRRTTPAFFGYVLSPPSPVGVAGELLAAAADQAVTTFRSAPAAVELERLTIGWLGRLVGFSDDGAGLLVSGGSMANLTALLLALRVRSAPDADRRTLAVLTSAEAHFSVAKAAGALGVRCVVVPVDEDRRMRPDALREAIASDPGTPICVVATAGTTATGAIDPLDECADVAAEHGLWLHVDGAYGAPAAAVPALAPLFAGLERADSLAVDAHKWLYAPIGCGALLVRDASESVRAFGSGTGDYVRIFGEDERESFAFWDHGLELTRPFRALGLWMMLRAHGASGLRAAIAEDIRLAEELAQLVRDDDELELACEPGLSICCFRHLPPGATTAPGAVAAPRALDDHNAALLHALQRDGRVYLSNATIDGRFALRACITNFRTTRADLERTLSVVRELGAAQAGSGAAG